MPKNDLGKALELLRFVRDWTQRELARKAQVRGGWMADYESGAARPEPEELRRMVAAMGFPPDAVERARRFLAYLHGESPAEEAPAASAEEIAALERELEQYEQETAGAAARLNRILRQLARRPV